MSNERKQSKLDELIQKYCPEGVSYISIKDLIKQKSICTITPSFKIKRNDYKESGSVPIISQEQEYISGYCERSDNNITQKNYVCFGDHSEHIKYVDFAFVQGADGLKIMHTNENIILARYLYHTALAYYKRHDNYERHFKYFGDTAIPLPPLEVQSEIVRILDNFTELTARKKQYEFYRNKLLTFGDAQEGTTSHVEWRVLSEIAEISTGSSNTDDAVQGGCYPFFVRSQQPLAKNEYEYDEEAIITAGDGVGVGKVFHYINGKYALHQRAYRIHPAVDELLGKYLYHYFVTIFPKYIGQQMYQGSVPSIRRPMLNKFQVAIPSLDVQKRIVNVLDNFDAICSDLNIGLPAEIEARKKQYEYYRDALLTYAATGKTILTDRQTDSQTDRQTDEYSALIRLCQFVFGYVFLPLEEIFDIRNGYTPSKANPEYWTNGTVDWFRMEDIRINGHVLSGALQKVSEAAVKGGRKIPANSIALSTSATIGEHALVTIECLGNQRFSFFTPKTAFVDMINMKFMNYYFYKVDEWCKGHLFQGNFNSVDMSALKQLCVPIPDTGVQEHIVSILDRFDALCNDLTSGLPAEIEARKKQYEYYRDKLLTFQQK